MKKLFFVPILIIVVLFSCKKEEKQPDDFLKLTIHDGPFAPYSYNKVFNNDSNVTAAFYTTGDSTQIGLMTGGLDGNHFVMAQFVITFAQNAVNSLEYQVPKGENQFWVFYDQSPFGPIEDASYRATSGTVKFMFIGLNPNGETSDAANVRGSFDVYVDSDQDTLSPFHVTGEFSNVANF